MGYLPGFATPRIVCDVPYVGKRWVHQVSRYDTQLGISSGPRTTGPRWRQTTRSRWTRREYAYYDPIHTLPADGQQWWLDRERDSAEGGLAPLGTGLTPAAP